jgi:hypothetical protein
LRESFDMNDEEAAQAITRRRADGWLSQAKGVVIPSNGTGLFGRFRDEPNGTDVPKAIASWVFNRQADSFKLEANITPGDAVRPRTPMERLKSGLSAACAG